MRRKTKKIISITSVILILVIVGTALVYHFYNPVKEFFNKTFNIKTEETASGSGDTTEEKVNIENLQSKLEETIAELGTTKAELEKVELEKAETVETLTAEKSNLENSLIKKTQELESTKAELEQQIADYSVLLDEKESVETELAAANSQITTLQSDLDQTNSDLESANSNIETLTARKTELETLLAESNETNTELETELASVKSDLESANSNNEELTARKTELETLLAESNEANEELETELASVNSELETANKTNAELTAKKTELETDLAEEQAQVEILTADLEIANANLEEKTAEVLELSSQVSSLTAEKTNLENEVAEKQVTIDNLESEIIILNAKIKEYEDALNEVDPSRELYSVLLSDPLGFYNISLSSGDILLSSKNSKSTGLFLINSVDYSISKIYDDTFVYSYQFMYELSSKKVLLSASTSGNTSAYVLLYNMVDGSITKLYKTYGFKYFYELHTGDVLLTSETSSKGLWLFENSTNSFSSLAKDGSSECGELSIVKLPDLNYLFSYNGTSKGKFVYVFDVEEKQVQKVYDSQLTTLIPLSNGNVLMTHSNSNYPGIYLFSSTDYSVSVVNETYASYSSYFQISDYTFLTSSNNNTGLLIYDTNNSTLEQLLTTGYSYSIYHKINDNEVLICGSSSTHLFEASTKSLTQIANYTMLGYAKCDLGDQNLALLNANGFLFIYDHTLKTISDTKLRYYAYIQNEYEKSLVANILSNGDVLISTNKDNVSGILLYKDKTISNVYSNASYKWTIVHELENGDVLICTSNSDSPTETILLYDSANLTFTTLSSDVDLVHMDKIEISENGVILSSTKNGHSAFYDYSEKTITKIN